MTTVHAPRPSTGPITARRPARVLWAALLLTVAAPVAINATSLYRLSVERLGLDGPVGLALPVTLDGAALVALVIRLRALRDGDAAAGASVAVALFGGLSAALAAIEGQAVGGLVGAIALGSLPIVAVVMLSLTTGALRREDLRAAGLIPPRPPYFSSLRWVLAPTTTFRAWRHGILWELSERSACLAATDAQRVSVVSLGPATSGGTYSGGRSELTREGEPTVDGQDDEPLSAVGGIDGRERSAGPAANGHGWVGTKRGLVRDLVAAGYRERAGIVAECARLGVEVSVREVGRILAEHSAAAASVHPIRSTNRPRR